MWKNININKQNVQTTTAKAVLIKMPHNSNYDGFCFWHPAKLIREGRNPNSFSLGYTEEFKFKLMKYGNGKWNKNTVIEEQTIDFEEFENAFEVMNENITAPDTKNDFETHKPQELEIKDVEVLEELKDE